MRKSPRKNRSNSKLRQQYSSGGRYKPYQPAARTPQGYPVRSQSKPTLTKVAIGTKTAKPVVPYHNAFSFSFIPNYRTKTAASKLFATRAAPKIYVPL